MKKIFIFIFFFSLFFFPKDTFAKTQVMIPDDIRFFQDNNILATRSPELLTLNGWELVGSGITSAINKVNYRYSSLGNLKYNTSYDLNFIIRQPNISVASLNSFNGGMPLVLVNDTVCSVHYSSSSQSNSTTYAPFFGVNCNNVFFDDTRGMHVNVISPYLSYEAGLYNNFYGISKSIGYNETQHSEEITNALDKNTESVKEQTEATKEQTDTIKDNDVSESESQAGGFFNDFDDNDFGLSDIITMPLSFIQGLANNSCSNLNLPLPFVDKNATLPCMTSIYQQHFGAFLTIYQIITTGFISYWVCINVFRLVKNFKDPNNDEVEVLDL